MDKNNSLTCISILVSIYLPVNCTSEQTTFELQANTHAYRYFKKKVVWMLPNIIYSRNLQELKKGKFFKMLENSYIKKVAYELR